VPASSGLHADAEGIAGQPSVASEAGAGAGAGRGSATAATVGTINVTHRLFLTPDEPGEIRVRTEFAVPENVASLTAFLDEGATIVDTAGLTATGNRSVEWDGDTSRATVTYDRPANETGRKAGPEGAGGDLLLADTGDWAIVERPSVGLEYRYRGSVSVTRTATVDGSGVVGTALAYLGPYDVEKRSAHRQTFRLVVPRAAALAEPRADILVAVGYASDALRVGDRDRSVLLLAAPTTVEWGVEGLQAGDADLYVTADERLDRPDSTWLHEYVHTRQHFDLGSDLRWFQEASATYYAALLTLEENRIGFGDFRNLLDRGTAHRYREVVLSRRATWVRGGAYYKGALVAGELDRLLRRASGGAATLQTVVGRMNGEPDFDGDALLSAIERHGGDLRTAADRYTTTRATPSPWSVSEHQATFGQLPARIEVALPARSNATAWHVDGPYRNEPLPAADRRLVTGESLTVAVPVTNAGGTAGEYVFAVRLGDRSVASRSGTVESGRTRRERVRLQPTTAGVHDLSVAGDAVGITVVEPAPLGVDGIAVNRTAVDRGAAIRATANVRNDASLPGETDLSITVDGRPVESRTVRLVPGERTAVSTVLRFEEPGTYRVAAGNESVPVTVEPGPTTPTTATTAADGGADPTIDPGTDPAPTSTTDAGGAGFGLPVALLAVAILAGLAGRRGRPE
jgi:hypothetical protein